MFKKITRHSDRITFIFSFVTCSSILIASRLMTPSPSGMGTHEQLGLPPCTFELFTGHGCPGCGLTTSFAHIVRLEFGQAFAANPTGFIWFLLFVGFIPYSLYRSFKPTSVDRLMESRFLMVLIVSVIIIMFIVWITRLILGLV